MTPLPPPLHGLTAFNQFLNYKLVPQPGGKHRKIPIGRGGRAVSPVDPAEWMTYDEALATGQPLAFCFSENDPFFFLDIDGALNADGSWSSLATAMCLRLAGCAVEVSSSGRGLHIFGVGAVSDHSNRRDDLGLEFYTRDRFVALTGTNAVGNCLHAPADLQALVSEYFPPSAHTVEADWTDGPVPEWRGPTDDDELIRRACRHVSAAAAFSGKASFADLWAGNTEALAHAFPSSNHPYDGSSADAALCAHLAWWTGKDCERMARLLRASGLARDKHDREDYVQRTVLNACRLSAEVLQDKPAAQLPPPAPPTPAPIAVSSAREAKPELVESVGYLRPDQTAELFKGCVYVRSLHRVWMPNGELLKPDTFKAFFGGFQFILDDVGKKTTDDAFKAFTNNPTIRCPQVATTCFDPKIEPGAIVTDFKGRDAVNTWKPPVMRCEQGDATPFYTHLSKLLPNDRDREILMSWMAAVVQYPGHKFLWSPVLQGVPGNGKSFFARVLQHAVGQEYSYTARSADLGKDFNAWIDGKIFVVVDDVRISDEDTYDRLKTIITERTQAVERKGVDADSLRIYANFMFTMNPKTGLRKASDDRRFAVFFTAQQKVEDLERDGMTGSYMVDLNEWAQGEGRYADKGEAYGFGIITHELRNYQIPDDLNPVTNAHRAPRTSAHDEVVASGMGQREQEVQEAIDSWQVGFRDGWVSAHYCLELLRKRDPRVRVSQLDEVLGNLSFVRHPGLKDGRTNNAVGAEGRVVLYVSQGRLDLMDLQGAAVAQAYLAAQSST